MGIELASETWDASSKLQTTLELRDLCNIRVTSIGK
jgi:hypothetical protein